MYYNVYTYMYLVPMPTQIDCDYSDYSAHLLFQESTDEVSKVKTQHNAALRISKSGLIEPRLSLDQKW